MLFWLSYDFGTSSDTGCPDFLVKRCRGPDLHRGHCGFPDLDWGQTFPDEQRRGEGQHSCGLGTQTGVMKSWCSKSLFSSQDCTRIEWVWFLCWLFGLKVFKFINEIIFQVEEATNKLSFVELRAQNLHRTVKLAWEDPSKNLRNNSRTINTGRSVPSTDQQELNFSKEQATRIARYICVFGISPGFSDFTNHFLMVTVSKNAIAFYTWKLFIRTIYTSNRVRYRS